MNLKISHLKLSSQRNKKENEENLGDLGDVINWTDIYIIGVPEEEERKGEDSLS